MATSVTTNEGRGPLEHAIQRHLEEYYNDRDKSQDQGIKNEAAPSENVGQDKPAR